MTAPLVGALASPVPATPIRFAAPLVKICGIRSVETALAAAEAGADLLGFNFAPVSRRRVDSAIVAEAIIRLRSIDQSGTVPCHPKPATRHPKPATHYREPLPCHPEPVPCHPKPLVCHPERSEGSASPSVPRSLPAAVGIFVNQPVDEVAALAAACSLDYLQLSGNEDPAYCAALAARTGLPIIKAIRLARAEESDHPESYISDGTVSMLLADAFVPGSWGGAGEAWDWSAAATLATRVPLLLAGGLTPDNVAGAIAAVRPHGVDVASGVETNGHTDPAKVKAFIQSAKRSPTHPSPSPHGGEGGRPSGGWAEG